MAITRLKPPRLSSAIGNVSFPTRLAKANRRLCASVRSLSWIRRPSIAESTWCLRLALWVSISRESPCWTMDLVNHATAATMTVVPPTWAKSRFQSTFMAVSVRPTLRFSGGVEVPSAEPVVMRKHQIDDAISHFGDRSKRYPRD